MKSTGIVLLAVAGTALSSAAIAQQKIGQVTQVTGDGTITREDIEFRARASAPLLVKDGIGTLKNSSLEATLLDGSTQTLDPDSSVTIEEFVHSPDSDIGNKLVLRLNRGSLTTTSGAIRDVTIKMRCGMVKSEEANLSISSGGSRDSVSNNGGTLQIIIKGTKTIVPDGSSASINDACEIIFDAPQDGRPPEGRPGQPDRIEPPGDVPQPSGEPGPPQPSPQPTPVPTIVPTPPVPTPTPPVVTPAPATPTPAPTAAPTASPTPPPPSPMPTPTPVSPL